MEAKHTTENILPYAIKMMYQTTRPSDNKNTNKNKKYIHLSQGKSNFGSKTKCTCFEYICVDIIPN
jgi:hypothetical protein